MKRTPVRRLEGKRAIVTGGGSGIGKASAIRFAREGAAVLVVGRAPNTHETVAEILGDGGVASGIVTDASIEENVEEIVRRCICELGGLEIFFANIGVTGTNTPLLEQTRRGMGGGLSHQHDKLFPRHQIRRPAYDGAGARARSS